MRYAVLRFSPTRGFSVTGPEYSFASMPADLEASILAKLDAALLNSTPIHTMLEHIDDLGWELMNMMTNDHTETYLFKKYFFGVFGGTSFY